MPVRSARVQGPRRGLPLRPSRRLRTRPCRTCASSRCRTGTYVGQSSHVADKSVAVPLDESTVAHECLDSRPFVLGGDVRAHLKARRMASRTIERALAKNPLATKHSDTFGGATLTVVGFLGPHPLGDQVGPLARPEVGEAERPGHWQADNFRHLAVIAEEVLGPGGRDVGAGQRGLKRGDAWPFLDGVDQIRGRRIREGVGVSGRIDIVVDGRIEVVGNLGDGQALRSYQATLRWQVDAFAREIGNGSGIGPRPGLGIW